MRAGPADSTQAPPDPRRSLRRTLGRCAIATVSLVFLAVLAAALLAWRAPSWWRGAGDPAAQEIEGADLENTLVHEMSRVRPGTGDQAAPRAWRSDQWTVELRSGEATAWLNTRLSKWLANQGQPGLPPGVGALQVEFQEDQVRLGAEVSGRVVWAVLRPRVEPDGSIWTQPARLYAGRLPLPSSWFSAGGVLRERVPGPVLAALDGRSPLTDRPVLTLGDGRRVRVLALRALEGRMEITCRTEAGADHGG